MGQTTLLLDEPKVRGPKDVQFYSNHAKGLLHTQRHKILEFIKARCIGYVGDGVFECLPIPGYNKTTYSLKKGVDGSWECNCQFYVTKSKKEKNPMCSHLGALFEFFARGRKYE